MLVFSEKGNRKIDEQRYGRHNVLFVVCYGYGG
jgi:hypothetical protein